MLTSLIMLVAAQAPELKGQAPKAQAPKVEVKKAQAPKAQAPKAQAPKAQAPTKGQAATAPITAGIRERLKERAEKLRDRVANLRG